MNSMDVALTYDLRQLYLEQGYSEEETAEFESAETIKAISTALHELGFTPIHVGNISQLVKRLASGERWDFVFSIAEGMHGFGREAQVPCVLDAFQIPYTFSDPLALTVTLHKATAKRLLRDLGIPTPDFEVIETSADWAEIELEYPLFVKPIAEGTSKGITSASRVCTPYELENVCDLLLEKFRQAVLVEEFLPGREFTIGIAGTGANARVLGVMEILLGPEAESLVYSYVNKAKYEELVRYRLVRDETAIEAADIALAAWRALGCCDAGRIDLRCDRLGKVQLLEVNALPGLHPIRSDLCILCKLAGIPYLGLIDNIMCSAIERSQSARGAPQPAYMRSKHDSGGWDPCIRRNA